MFRFAVLPLHARSDIPPVLIAFTIRDRALFQQGFPGVSLRRPCIRTTPCLNCIRLATSHPEFFAFPLLLWPWLWSESSCPPHPFFHPAPRSRRIDVSVGSFSGISGMSLSTASGVQPLICRTLPTWLRTPPVPPISGFSRQKPSLIQPAMGPGSPTTGFEETSRTPCRRLRGEVLDFFLPRTPGTSGFCVSFPPVGICTIKSISLAGSLPFPRLLFLSSVVFWILALGSLP